MDAYPVFSLTQNIPLLVTIGLPPGVDGGEEGGGDEAGDAWMLDADLKEQATLLRSELPVLSGEHEAEFERYITAGDVSGPVPAGSRPWRGRASTGRYRFRIRTAARTYYLPHRRARLPDNVDAADLDPQQIVLHSPFSPLSPSCSLYPDGILDARWIQKHQEIVPSVFLCFYALSADATTATLQDNRIKADISTFRTAVQQSGYRSRVAVAVFVGAHDDHVQERLDNIRKGSGTDAKLFFAIPTASTTPDDLHRVAENMLTTVYAAPAMDYYRELGRHSRKKRGRRSAPQPSMPPTSGTSQTLSLAGWHIRYDVKAAVLAEFRQETDAALRLLEQAYDALLGPEVLFGVIPNWSPRWNEARLLADTLAVRILRCLLMAAQHSAAVRRWAAHRDRLRVLLDARGRGTANYGWQAWEARWAVVMADLIDRVGVLELRPPPRLPVAGGEEQDAAVVFFVPPEKALAADRLAPWEQLHHRGYWFRLAARHTAARRRLAYAIPEADRHPPDTSPASLVTHRAFVYDDYMCPPPHREFPLMAGHGPGINHAAAIVAYLEAARAEFLLRGQVRVAAELALECGREYVGAREWQAAIDLLAPLWPVAAAEAWFDVREELAWTLRTALVGAYAEAADKNDRQPQTDLLVVLNWELLDGRYARRPGWSYDVAEAVAREPSAEGSDGDNDAEKKDVPISVALPEGVPPPSFLSAMFVFKNGEAKAGGVALAQLAIHSNARAGSPPVVWDEIRVHFDDGSVRPIVLKHSATAPAPTAAGGGKVAHAVVSLDEGDDVDSDDTADDSRNRSNSLCGAANLILRPQSTLVLEVAIPLHMPGDARAVAVDLVYRCPAYALQLLAVPLASHSPAWYLPRASAFRVAVPRPDSHAIHILPRPPKLDIRLLTKASAVSTTVQRYTNEAITLALELTNGEDADASVKLDVIMESAVDPAGADSAAATADDEDDSNAPPGFTLLVAGDEIDTASGSGSSLPTAALRSVPLGRVATATSVALVLQVPHHARQATLVVTVRAVYHLVSDPGTPIAQQIAFTLSLVNPFEANYDLLPRLHPAPWPSLFDDTGIVATLDTADVAADATEAPAAAAAAVSTPHGLSQAWALVTRYASFAVDDLRVVGLDLVIKPVPGGRIVCRHKLVEDADGPGQEDGTIAVIRPHTMEEAQFDLEVQKTSLDDRNPVHLDVAFVIRWQRQAADDTAAAAEGAASPTTPVNTTTLPVPRLALFGTEPRVLASVAYIRRSRRRSGGARSPAPTTIALTVAIENASSHFLTFGLTMEPSNEFAFSGAKMTTVHVLPMSRRTATYRLLPLAPPQNAEGGGSIGGTWIRPGLVVRDKYFQKVLRILPTEGMKMDKEGILIWVPLEEDSEDEQKEESET